MMAASAKLFTVTLPDSGIMKYRIHIRLLPGLFFLMRILLLPSAAVALTTKDGLRREIQSLSLNELKEREAQINEELAGLARLSLRSDVGVIGFRSKDWDTPHHREWIHIELEQEVIIDEIVLVPTIWKASEHGYKADGFPQSFRILAGNSKDKEGRPVVAFGPDDPVLPGVAPFSLPVDQERGSWIRLEASELTPRGFDGRYILQLAEIMVFQGNENVALGKPVTSSSFWKQGRGTWSPEAVADGFLPYLMDAAEGGQSVAAVSQTGIGEFATVSIDLGAPYLLNQINLHTVEQSDTVPQSYAGDFGFPKQLIVEGANLPDFSGKKTLLDFRQRTDFEIGPIITRRLNPMQCRYVRLTAKKLYLYAGYDDAGEEVTGTRFGLAEVELLSGNTNVALNKPVQTSFEISGDNRSIEALTDGHNLYGTILPLRTWMSQLSKRHELEIVKPLVVAELNRRYEVQKRNLNRLSWGFAILAAVSIMLFLWNRSLKQRAIFQTRQRIAADLHDELGANLHAISMLGELAAKATKDPDKLKALLERMRALLMRTNKAVKYCTNILETPGLYEDFEAAMKRNADRLLADLEHELKFEAADIITKMRPGRRIGLFLFYKECLINIIRHSGSTHAETRVTTEGRNLHLQVYDNGRGFPESLHNRVPKSLKRRAKLLGGKVSVYCPPAGGAKINLSMKV